jgi:endonuclease/exonuclease/phosphatase family metal-dependent hydrolase
LRLGTYNVLGLTGYPPQAARAQLVDAARTVEHFAAVFRGLNCDVLALQEGPALEVIRRIAERLEVHLAAFPSPTAYPGYVLSRHPVRESRTYSHVGPGGKTGPFSRCAGAARLAAGGRELWVVDVHLHPHDAARRAREADLLAAQLGALLAEDAPAVVMGDFNCPVGEPVHEMLQGRGFVNAMARAGGGIIPTMDTAGLRPLAIDHIYLSPGLAAAGLTSARVVRDAGFRADEPTVPGTWVHSDHLPVVAELRWA